MVVQAFRRLVFASHINYDVSSRPDARVTRAHHLRIAEMFGELTQKGASQHLVAVEAAIVGADLFLHQRYINTNILALTQEHSHWEQVAKQGDNCIFWVVNKFIAIILKSIVMENNRKRRGISLSHNSFKQPQPLTQSSCPFNTRFQYVRYPIAPPRPLSANKTRINFNYTANHRPYFQQNASVYNSSFVGDPSYLAQKEAIPMAEDKPKDAERSSQVSNKKAETSFLEEASKGADYIPHRYSSFQQCKEVLGQRLFGTIKTANSKVNQTASRTSAFKIPDIEEFSANFTQNIDNPPHCNAFASNLPKPIEQPLQDSLRMNIPAAEQPKARKAALEQIMGTSEAKVSASQENKARTSEGKERLKKDPIRLQEMERRLLEIIKICDQNA